VNISTKFTLLGRIECTLRSDCSIPLLLGHSQLMVPWPDEESRSLAPIRPFQFEVNFCLVENKIFELPFPLIIYYVRFDRYGCFWRFRFFVLHLQSLTYPNSTRRVIIRERILAFLRSTFWLAKVYFHLFFRIVNLSFCSSL